MHAFLHGEKTVLLLLSVHALHTAQDTCTASQDLCCAVVTLPRTLALVSVP